MVSTQSVFRVALDAMGGDHGPREVVAGAVQAVKAGGVAVALVGDPAAVNAELAKLGAQRLPIQVVPSEGVITDDEHPVLAVRQKPRASVLVATGLVKAGKADAVVSMGSTGATMAAATLLLGTIGGIVRPSIGGPFLGLNPRVVVLDLGSNVDIRPIHFLNFAAMGTVFSRTYLGIEKPRVGMLSVGSEDAKGNRQVQEALPVLRASGLNVIGNVEGYDFFTDRADVIVCDGFVGNVVMKFAEGMGAAVGALLAKRLAGKLPQAEIEALGQQLYLATNLAKVHGGPLFGVNGMSIVGHGASRAEGIAGAVALAKRLVDVKLVEALAKGLAEYQGRARQAGLIQQGQSGT